MTDEREHVECLVVHQQVSRVVETSSRFGSADGERTDAMPTESKRARIKPLRERGLMRYDQDTIYRIVDEALVCHTGYQVDGEARVVPLMHVRIGDQLFLHGSTGSRLMLAASGVGTQVCVSVTLLDALVFARAQFMHTLNYRSVTVHGQACPVTEEGEKRAVMAALLDKLARGRSADTRPPSSRELAQTAVLTIPLVEVSARIQTGGVADEPEDMALAHWAGVIPLRMTAGPAREDHSAVAVPLPDYMARYQLGESE
ncbi:pyridoxamine 5'-phosphate oxidase family protein [Streptomyces sp. NPDC007205]|uniref:pyridoxamine 5'-phosphate oxidase family protein n=1 Tax=Streptomyces sp. NPDC007205 TaxID=3154316 RepID=UPI0033DCD278